MPSSFQTVRTDSNKDGALNGRDQSELMLTRPDGSGQVVIAKNVDQFHGLTFANDIEIVVIFTRKGLTTAGHFSTTDFSQKRMVPLSRKASDDAESSEL